MLTSELGSAHITNDTEESSCIGLKRFFETFEVRDLLDGTLGGTSSAKGAICESSIMAYVRFLLENGGAALRRVGDLCWSAASVQTGFLTFAEVDRSIFTC